MDPLRAKTADLVVRWQEVNGLVDFNAGIEALIAGDPTPITLLIKGAECNKEIAKKLAFEQQANDFQQWLSQAKLRGHSGIYKCLKAPDNVHVRPFRNVPVQQRQDLEGTTMGAKPAWHSSSSSCTDQIVEMRGGSCSGPSRHFVIDLQCFYDSVELSQLLQLWESFDFPLHI